MYKLFGAISRAELAEIIHLVINGKNKSVLEKIDQIYENGVDLIKFVEDAMIFLKDLYIYSIVLKNIMETRY